MQGELVHFAVYMRRDNAAEAESSAGRVVEMTGAGATGTEANTDKQSQRTSQSLLPRLDTAIGPAMGPLSPHIRTPRERPTSSDADDPTGRVVTPRGALHGDVAASRHEESLNARRDSLAAREAQVSMEESRLMRLKSELLQLQEDLNKQRLNLGSRNQNPDNASASSDDS